MTDDSDLGGEPACWAHIVDEPDAVAVRATVVDLDVLTGTSGEGSGGAIWSLPHDGDLDGNVVWLPSGDVIEQHVNDEVDVLVVVWSGAGELTVDGRVIPLRPGVVVQVERGADRGFRAGSEGVTYLSVHRRRDGLTITRR
jgi:quercetin dioxygenase-like cupin family protein